MAHGKHFDEADPVLARLRGICLDLPGADEKITHGRPCFFTKKIFAIYGASTKGDHQSGRYAQSALFLADESEVPAISDDDRFFVPAYWGPYGWWGIDLSDASDADWAEVAELMDMSFRNTAGKRLIAELDERG